MKRAIHNVLPLVNTKCFVLFFVHFSGKPNHITMSLYRICQGTGRGAAILNRHGICNNGLSGYKVDPALPPFIAHP
jgi:hypothetical protein